MSLDQISLIAQVVSGVFGSVGAILGTIFKIRELRAKRDANEFGSASVSLSNRDEIAQLARATKRLMVLVAVMFACFLALSAGIPQEVWRDYQQGRTMRERGQAADHTPTYTSEPNVYVPIVQPTLQQVESIPTQTTAAIGLPVQSTESESMAAQTEYTYVPPGNAVELGAGATIGYFYVLTSGSSYTVVTPPGGQSVIAGGNYVANDRYFESDGSAINLYLVVCNSNTECLTPVSGYSAGNLGVTTMLSGRENPARTALNAVRLGFEPSNCGNGCRVVRLYQDDMIVQEFTSEPSSIQIKGF